MSSLCHHKRQDAVCISSGTRVMLHVTTCHERGHWPQVASCREGQHQCSVPGVLS